MKVILKAFSLAPLLCLIASAAHADAPKAPATKAVAARSVFVVPTGVKDGRDPFYPESSRVYEDNPASQKHAIDENSFKIKGMSYEHGHAMVIVNNHTFATGDEGDVLTTAGRVHLRVVSIRPDTVTIEVNGTRHELSTGNK